MAQKESISQLNGKSSCAFCLKRGKFETLLNHNCELDNSGHKETSPEARNTSNIYKTIGLNPSRPQKVKDGNIFIGMIFI